MELPVVSGNDAVSVFLKIGYEFDVQHGSHMLLRHRSPPHRRLSVPNHKELANGTLRALIRDAGLTVEEFARLLYSSLSRNLFQIRHHATISNMHRLLIALLAVLSATAAQTDSSAVMSAVNQFVDSFNKGDAKTAAAACAEQTSIIDEFPPHGWHGAGACAKWMNDYDVDAKKRGITDGIVKLDQPRHLDVAGSVAYVVMPADYAYKVNGKPEKETASMLTLVLRKTAAGWRITGWSWSKN